MGRKAPSLRDGQRKTHIDDDEEDPKLTQSPAATQPQPPTQALLTRSSPKATNPTTRTGNSLLSVPVAPLGLAAPEPHASIPRTRSASAAKPSSPSSNTSSIPVHDVYNYFTHDFSTGANANFAALLAKNGVSGGAAETGNATMV
jgi:hypothetical protein